MTMQDNNPNLGSRIDELTAIRDHKRTLTAELKAVSEHYDTVKGAVLDALDAQDMIQGRGRTASATVTETVVPNVREWDAVQAYIRANEADYLYERRISATAWRELLESGIEVPGIQPFTRRDIALRKAA